MKVITLLTILLTTAIAHSAEYDPSEFETIYEGKKSRVILTSSGKLPQEILTAYGKSTCRSKRSCVLWFYPDKKQADVGVEAMKKGDMFAQTPGLYGIFSKSKITNDMICYSPEIGC